MDVSSYGRIGKKCEINANTTIGAFASSVPVLRVFHVSDFVNDASATNRPIGLFVFFCHCHNNLFGLPRLAIVESKY